MFSVLLPRSKALRPLKSTRLKTFVLLFVQLVISLSDSTAATLKPFNIEEFIQEVEQILPPSPSPGPLPWSFLLTCESSICYTKAGTEFECFSNEPDIFPLGNSTNVQLLKVEYDPENYGYKAKYRAIYPKECLEYACLEQKCPYPVPWVSMTSEGGQIVCYRTKLGKPFGMCCRACSYLHHRDPADFRSLSCCVGCALSR